MPSAIEIVARPRLCVHIEVSTNTVHTEAVIPDASRPSEDNPILAVSVLAALLLYREYPSIWRAIDLSRDAKTYDHTRSITK